MRPLVSLSISQLLSLFRHSAFHMMTNERRQIYVCYSIVGLTIDALTILSSLSLLLRRSSSPLTPSARFPTPFASLLAILLLTTSLAVKRKHLRWHADWRLLSSKPAPASSRPAHNAAAATQLSWRSSIQTPSLRTYPYGLEERCAVEGCGVKSIATSVDVRVGG